MLKQTNSALAILTAGLLAAHAPAAAQDVAITQDMPFFEFDNGREFIVIERNQDTEARIEDAFAKTSRPCPPFCIQPMEVAPGVETVGELEVLEFLSEHVETGTGFLIDARTEDWFMAATIPGSVNMPFKVFENSKSNPFLEGLLLNLGGAKLNGEWNLSAAKELCLFCNGPWCGQSPRAIQNLLELGYPPEKIRYYRGGMQSWLMLGMSTYRPGSVGG